MQIHNLLTENKVNPIGLGEKKPCFSYQLKTEKRYDKQTAFQIQAATNKILLENNQVDLWDSGKCLGEDNFSLEYNGKELHSRSCVWWRVRVWDKDDEVSEWSEIAYFELGLLHMSDWKAVWIGENEEKNDNRSAAPAFVKMFSVKKRETVLKARLYISGLGLYEASLNGKAISEDLFEPGESEYNKRVFYRTYDITSFLSKDENVIGVILGNGQYCNFAVAPVMRYGNGELCETHRYQKDDTAFLKDGICGNKKLIVQIEVTRMNGDIETVLLSDESWKYSNSAITFQNWYGGEDYDARIAHELQGWDTVGYDWNNWTNAVQVIPPKGILAAREFLPIRIVERWSASSVRKLKNGNYLVDMGKNSAGFVNLKLRNTQSFKGRTISMYPAEILKSDESGVDQSTCTQSCDKIFSCVVKDCYTIAGTGNEEWHPIFCYHGFQYVEVEGFPGEPSIENFEGCAVRVINEKFSDFETSDNVLNKINQITDRSIESNMMSCFTDCPQIEKLGWLETSHLMFASMTAGYDIRSWIPKIIQDAADAQVKGELVDGASIVWNPKMYPGADYNLLRIKETEGNGFVPGIAPEYFRIGALYKDPNWGGACILSPWYYYLEYGDKKILERFFSVMCEYIEHLKKSTKDGILKSYAQMGEWGQLHENTPTTLVATCSFYLQVTTLKNIAVILGKKEFAIKYQILSEKIQRDFYKDLECTRIENRGRVFGNGSQASYGCVLFSGIIKESDKEEALHHLIWEIERNENNLNSGEVGLKQVFYSLAAMDRNDVVYKMVMNPKAPSYKHHIDWGLTTLPEFWDYTELWNGLGRSRNHAMMGHVKEWLFSFVLGIRLLEAGYRKAIVSPYLQEGLYFVKGSKTTVRGKIEVDCSWKNGKLISEDIKKVDKVHMKVVIPPGACADIRIPCPNEKFVLLKNDFEGEKEGNYFYLKEVPSGVWEFMCKYQKETESVKNII